MTSADLLVTSMAAKLIYSTYLHQALVGLEWETYHIISEAWLLYGSFSIVITYSSVHINVISQVLCKQDFHL